MQSIFTKQLSPSLEPLKFESHTSLSELKASEASYLSLREAIFSRRGNAMSGVACLLKWMVSQNRIIASGSSSGNVTSVGDTAEFSSDPFSNRDWPSAKCGPSILAKTGDARLSTFDEARINSLSGPTSNIKSPAESASWNVPAITTRLCNDDLKFSAERMMSRCARVLSL